MISKRGLMLTQVRDSINLLAIEKAAGSVPRKPKLWTPVPRIKQQLCGTPQRKLFQVFILHLSIS